MCHLACQNAQSDRHMPWHAFHRAGNVYHAHETSCNPMAFDICVIQRFCAVNGGGGQRQLPFSRLDLLEKSVAQGHPLQLLLLSPTTFHSLTPETKRVEISSSISRVVHVIQLRNQTLLPGDTEPCSTCKTNTGHERRSTGSSAPGSLQSARS